MLKNLSVLLLVVLVGDSCSDSIPESAFEEAMVWVVVPDNLGKVHRLTSKMFDNKLSNQKGVVIDVRTAKEFNYGHIPQAINIDFYRNDFANLLSTFDTKKPIFIYGHTGSRSGMAAKVLLGLGFKEIYDLTRGFAGWKSGEHKVSKQGSVLNVSFQEKIAIRTPELKSTLASIQTVDVDAIESVIAADKVTVVDVRTPREYQKGHLDGALNVDWKSPNFTEKILNVSNHKPIVVYGHSGQRSQSAMFHMVTLGFTEIFDMKDGILAWVQSGNKTSKYEKLQDPLHLSVKSFKNTILANEGTLIDVRTSSEYDSYHIQGAKLIDVKSDDFESKISKLDKQVPLVMYCRSGARSLKAARIAEQLGYTVLNLDDGILGWISQGQKVVKSN